MAGGWPEVDGSCYSRWSQLANMESHSSQGQGGDYWTDRHQQVTRHLNRNERQQQTELAGDSIHARTFPIGLLCSPFWYYTVY